jgi:energy-coupling factor transporter ATP-binding protein EcfA2
MAKIVGMVFDNPEFQLSQMSVGEEIALGLESLGYGYEEMVQTIDEVLAIVGLQGLIDRSPFGLSGGQQQRVAIARALVTGPDIVLADEPTGALDSKTGAAVIDLLKDLHREGRTIVLITHDLEIAASAPRRVFLRDGQVERDERGAN